MSSAQRFLPQCWPHRADFIGSIPFRVALPSSSPCAAPSPGYAESRAAPVQSPALLSGPTGHPHHRQRLESVDLQYSKGECQISVYMHVRTHSSVLQGRSGCSCDSCFILLHFLAWCKAASCLVSCTQLCPGAVRGAAGGHLCWLYRCSSALLQDSTLLPLGQLQGCVRWDTAGGCSGRGQKGSGAAHGAERGAQRGAVCERPRQLLPPPGTRLGRTTARTHSAVLGLLGTAAAGVQHWKRCCVSASSLLSKEAFGEARVCVCVCVRGAAALQHPQVQLCPTGRSMNPFQPRSVWFPMTPHSSNCVPFLLGLGGPACMQPRLSTTLTPWLLL